MISVGTDIIEIDRFKDIENIDKFLEKNFSKNEQNYIKTKKNKFETIAGIFACKEAVMKAFKKGIFTFSLTKVEILKDENNAPYVFINEEISNLLKEFNASEICVSISHSKNYATSVCVIK